MNRSPRRTKNLSKNQCPFDGAGLETAYFEKILPEDNRTRLSFTLQNALGEPISQASKGTVVDGNQQRITLVKHLVETMC